MASPAGLAEVGGIEPARTATKLQCGLRSASEINATCPPEYGTDQQSLATPERCDIHIIMSNQHHTLMQGDCLELMQTIPDGSVDLILCDLPYGTTRNKWDSIIDLEAMWAEYKRICRGAIVLTAQTPFDKVLGASNLAMLRYEWIWEKTHPTGHLNAKRAPMKAHENVLVFYERQPTYNPIKTRGHKRKSATKRKDNTTSYGEQNFDALSYDSTERYPRSVLLIPSDKQRSGLHPTQKPVALMEYLIRTYANEGETVLDNCMGSGTTGVACVNTGRNFIGIERDPGYFEIARARIEAASAAKGA